jgi:hypothetical protein
MGLAVDTVLAFSTQAGAGAFPIALAATTGDSLVVRSTNGASKGHLDAIICASGTAGQKFRVASPLLHDNVTGLTLFANENPANFMLPAEIQVDVSSQDTLSVFGSCAGATTITMGLAIQYDDLRGIAADLYRWSDLKDNVKQYKAIEVSLSAIAVGAWTDTVITATENQLHADSSYAVIGYTTTVGVDIVGVKGVATGNLRMCGPGPGSTLDVSGYYVYQSEQSNKPYVPVFQANDRGGFYVSAANHAAIGGGGAEVSLLVAELSGKY